MNHLSGLTPFLDEAAEKMPLDQMYQKMTAFESAYDQMVVKGKMVSDTIENNLAEKGSITGVTSDFTIDRQDDERDQGRTRS
jgi:hypothetical protein